MLARLGEPSPSRHVCPDLARLCSLMNLGRATPSGKPHNPCPQQPQALIQKCNSHQPQWPPANPPISGLADTWSRLETPNQKPGVHCHCEASRPLGHLQSSAADWQAFVACTCLHTQTYIAARHLKLLHRKWHGKTLFLPELESGARARQINQLALPSGLLHGSCSSLHGRWSWIFGHTTAGHSQHRQHLLALGTRSRRG